MDIRKHHIKAKILFKLAGGEFEAMALFAPYLDRPITELKTKILPMLKKKLKSQKH